MIVGRRVEDALPRRSSEVSLAIIDRATAGRCLILLSRARRTTTVSRRNRAASAGVRRD